MGKTSTSWEKGCAPPNPKGRPPKSRALTAILEKAGAKAHDIDGKRVAGKRLLATMVWELATTGKATFPDGTELQVSPRDWIEVVKWLYSQIDGPPKAEQAIEHTGAGGRELIFRVVYADDDGIPDQSSEGARQTGRDTDE